MPEILNLARWWYTGSCWVYLIDWKNHRSTGGHYIVGSGRKGVPDRDDPEPPDLNVSSRPVEPVYDSGCHSCHRTRRAAIRTAAVNIRAGTSASSWARTTGSSRSLVRGSAGITRWPRASSPPSRKSSCARGGQITDSCSDPERNMCRCCPSSVWLSGAGQRTGTAGRTVVGGRGICGPPAGPAAGPNSDGN